MKTQNFDYHQAFDRNLGWLTPDEQAKLRASCVAIAGLGGAGGFQAQALARLGVGRFKLADPDIFEMSNLNRQAGATSQTLGQSKVAVLQEMILSINPEAEVEAIAEPISHSNVGSFLGSVDLVIDGIDFFELGAKMLLFEECRRKKIPALTCGPIGFGATLIVFSPEGMSFTDYFDIRKGMDEKQKSFAFAFGLSPTPLCLGYMGSNMLNIDEKRGASVSPGLMLVGALTATEAVKILTGKWKVHFCPNIYQIDLLTQKVKKRWYLLGMRSPWQQLKKKILIWLVDGKQKFSRQGK